ncbi:MAG: nucleotide exchange factor GrpE [Polyangiaceae bacterium]|nr:nucleotide exchange factor GrpE [Polyangiaceae bacterium]
MPGTNEQNHDESDPISSASAGERDERDEYDECDDEAETESAKVPDELVEARAEAARMKDQWMRSAADFDNFRKRARREIDDARKGGREDLLKDVLPVFDNLERAIQSAQHATDVQAVTDGLNLIVRQLTDTLGRIGITRVQSVGQPFDPAVHDAIQLIESGDHPEGTVVAEVRSGYLQGDKLVRAAMVVVSKAPSKSSEVSDDRDDVDSESSDSAH